MFVLTQDKEKIIQPTRLQVIAEDVSDTTQVFRIIDTTTSDANTILGTYGELEEAGKIMQRIFVAIMRNRCFKMPVSYTLARKARIK